MLKLGLWAGFSQAILVLFSALDDKQGNSSVHVSIIIFFSWIMMTGHAVNTPDATFLRILSLPPALQTNIRTDS